MLPNRIPRNEVSERRAEPRVPCEAFVTVRIDATAIAGTAENVSDSGILFFSHDCPRVEVEVVEGGHLRHLHGRLIRMQRLRGNSTGYAVELDPGSEAVQ